MATVKSLPPSIEAEQILGQLDKILSSQAFAKALRLRAFLEYVVRHAAVSGEEGSLKEAIIGAEVYRRDPAYDTKEEPIVRVEARRLRARLELYYQGEGQGDPIQISIPKGGYLPAFEFRSKDCAPEIASCHPERAHVQPEITAVAAAEPLPFSVSPLQAKAGPPPAAVFERRRGLGAAGAVLVGAALLSAPLWLIVRARARQQAAPVLTHVEPLTSFAGSTIQAALSPDGREIAYAWHGPDAGNFDIYVKQTEIGNPVRLTGGAAQHLHPAWSPDGRYLSFLRMSPDTAELVVLPALGGPERVVAQIHPHVPWKGNGVEIEGDPGPVWSPDGQSLVAADGGTQDPGAGLISLSLKDGEKHKLTNPPPPASDGFPAFSPDGTQLAFVRQFSHSVRDIDILSLKEGSVRQLLSEGKDIRGLAWSKNGSDIVFSSNRGGSYQLWRIASSGGAPESISASGDQLTDPSVARDGGSLVYTNTTENSNIWRIPLQAGPDSSRPTEVITSTRHNHSPQYSPDGKAISFISDRSGSWEVWIANTDGSNPQQLTRFEGPMVGTPHWSPDGRSLVFDARPKGKSDIFLVPAAGGPPVQLTDNDSENKVPYWSHDGRWIYYASNAGGPFQLWKQTVEGGKPIRLTTMVCHDSLESPDGRAIYFETDGRGIWKVLPDGSGPMPVPELSQLFPNRYLAIDSTGLYFVQSDASPHRIVKLRFADHRMETLGVIARNLVDGTPSLSISPDGRWAIFAQMDESSSSLMRLRNFR